MNSPINILYYFIQFTWGIIQNIIGLLLYLLLKINKAKTNKYRNALVTHWHNHSGLSLGMFIFVDTDDERLLKHEYGHSIQSLILGPFYLIIVGIPSLIWALLFKNYRKHKNINYYSLKIEKWADKLGGHQL